MGWPEELWAYVAVVRGLRAVLGKDCAATVLRKSPKLGTSGALGLGLRDEVVNIRVQG